MRKLFLLAVVSTLWLTFAGSAAADSTYQVNVPVGVGSVTGTITTNGFIGTLSTLDIVAFSLTLSDGTASAMLTNPGGNGSVFISGSNTTATATQLLFDFNGNGAFMNFFETTACSPPMWSLHTDGGEACNGTTGDAMGVASTGTGVFSPPQSGSVVIGTRSAPVPEPGTLGLTVAGLVSLIGLRKRRSIGAPDRPVREPSA